MAYEFQVAVDCADPHTLADWWAETLGWQVEPSDEAFIRRMISAGYAAESDTKTGDDLVEYEKGAVFVCQIADGLEIALPGLLRVHRFHHHRGELALPTFQRAA